MLVLILINIFHFKKIFQFGFLKMNIPIRNSIGKYLKAVITKRNLITLCKT